MQIKGKPLIVMQRGFLREPTSVAFLAGQSSQLQRDYLIAGEASAAAEALKLTRPPRFLLKQVVTQESEESVPELSFQELSHHWDCSVQCMVGTRNKRRSVQESNSRGSTCSQPPRAPQNAPQQTSDSTWAQLRACDAVNQALLESPARRKQH